MNSNERTAVLPGRVGLLALLWLMGLYLRLPVLVAPPLAPGIAAELSLNQAQLGALTTVPVLMLALGALPGSVAISRLGAPSTLVIALVVLALASAARGLAPPVLVLFAFTALMGLAIAVMQPALPVLVQRWCPGYMALGSAVYMNGMLAGEFIGAGLTLPLVMPWLDGDWRDALLFWSLPALAVAGWLAVLGRQFAPAAGATTTAPAGPAPWRQARVWKLGLLLGAASAGFFGTNAYLGPLLAARGEADQLAAVLFYFNATQVAGSLLMVALARLLAGRPGAARAVACLLPIGLLGTALASGAVFFVAVVVLGLCTCVQLILMVSLVPQVAGEGETGPLAAGMFAVGYLLGFVVPLAGGGLADVTGDPRMALAPMGVLALLGAAVAVWPGFGHGWPSPIHPSTVRSRRR